MDYKFFWYDHTEKDIDVNNYYMPNISGLKEITDFYKAERLECAKELKGKGKKSICFAHTGEKSGNQQKDWEIQANSFGPYVVLISTEPLSLSSTSIGVYTLKMLLKLFYNNGIAKSFLQSCKNDTPDWNLLSSCPPRLNQSEIFTPIIVLQLGLLMEKEDNGSFLNNINKYDKDKKLCNKVIELLEDNGNELKKGLCEVIGLPYDDTMNRIITKPEKDLGKFIRKHGNELKSIISDLIDDKSKEVLSKYSSEYRLTIIENLFEIVKDGAKCSKIIKEISRLRHIFKGAITRLNDLETLLASDRLENFRKNINYLEKKLVRFDANLIDKYFCVKMKNEIIEISKLIKKFQNKINVEAVNTTNIIIFRNRITNRLQKFIKLIVF